MTSLYTATATTELLAAHDKLRAHPVVFATMGVVHTLLMAGIVFGWASLLPILRKEGIHLSPPDFARIFTRGAVGNYLSSFPLGYFLDRAGPKKCGILSSLLFGLGLVLRSYATSSTTCLDVGFALLGFAGPAIQLPTLHLARLFPSDAQGSGGSAALIMSAQAGAFDGGTMVFAFFSALVGLCGITSKQFFRLYTFVPALTMMTAILYWPDRILPAHEEDDDVAVMTNGQSDNEPVASSYVGRSPYLSPAAALSLSARRRFENNGLQDAPLSTVLRKPPFYALAIWVSVHILKLNFVVMTINDQLAHAVNNSRITVTLIGIFGAMLPFGFVVLPLVAYMLGRSAFTCFQVANVVGILYGAVLTFASGVASFDIFIVFVAVATSRQLVYSTVFHQTGELFGFRNYGVILGLINIMVSSFSMVQGPLVDWAERSQGYMGPNCVLLLATIPLFAIVYWTTDLAAAAVKPPTKKYSGGKSATESSPLVEKERLIQIPRRFSGANIMA